MKVTVRLFAQFREIVGEKQKEVEIEDGMTLHDIIPLLIKEYPDLKKEKIIVSLNHKYAHPEEILKDDDEIALFPPVSGG
ncbi:MAG TPA: molybdopterin converting factor subunit 1 [Candidatus Bathyarchaeia archaeon]|nr:molybdopterin converting factor subunit 1 [Candidatus Bathyarchaeia archaeon]